MPSAEHPNVITVREMFAAFHSADLAAIMRAIPERLVWHFPGRHGGPEGAHRGREGVLAFLARVADPYGHNPELRYCEAFQRARPGD